MKKVNQELQQLLRALAWGLGNLFSNPALNALFGVNPVDADGQIPPAEQCDFSNTKLWRLIHQMHAYGVRGEWSSEFGASPLSMEYAKVELLMRAISETEMGSYLFVHEADTPQSVIRTVQTCVARHVLEGGQRWADYENMSEEAGKDHLTIQELALLADMDERSVRNACNPKHENALTTVIIDKRTMITRNTARDWLSGRKGYVPLQLKPSMKVPSCKKKRPPVSLELPADLVDALHSKANAQGLDVNALLQRIVST